MRATVLESEGRGKDEMADCGKPRNRGFVGGQVILGSLRQDLNSYVFQL